MIGTRHSEHLSVAFRRLVGDPIRGSVTFHRGLPSDLLDALIDAPNFGVEGWTIAAVVDKAGPRRITTDQAVEQREDKAEPVLFLIDPLRAGAGLDGIYSAAHEITEADLFKEAQKEARRSLRGQRGFADMAVKRAQRLGRRHRLTPWQRFDFLVAVEKNGAGAALAGLGLWPIESDGAPSDEDLSLSAALSDRLLFVQDARPPGDRVRALLLEDAAQETALEAFLRQVADRSPLQAARELESCHNLWLGPLKPRFLRRGAAAGRAHVLAQIERQRSEMVRPH